MQRPAERLREHRRATCALAARRRASTRGGRHDKHHGHGTPAHSTHPGGLMEISPAVRAVLEHRGLGGDGLVMEAVNAFADHSPRWSLMLAALAGLPRLVQRLSRRHPTAFDRCCEEAMDAAAEFGHLEIVQWLDKNREEGCSTDAMDLAAANGHLEVVQWLHYNRKEGCTPNAMDFAAMNGHLEVVQWLHEHREEGCTHDAMDNAASSGHLAVIEWLHLHRTEGCSKSALVNALHKSHHDVARWLLLHRQRSCGARAILSYYVALRETSDLLDWLSDQTYLTGLLSDEEDLCSDTEEDEEEVEDPDDEFEAQRHAAIVRALFPPEMSAR